MLYSSEKAVDDTNPVHVLTAVEIDPLQTSEKVGLSSVDEYEPASSVDVLANRSAVQVWSCLTLE